MAKKKAKKTVPTKPIPADAEKVNISTFGKANSASEGGEAPAKRKGRRPKTSPNKAEQKTIQRSSKGRTPRIKLSTEPVVTQEPGNGVGRTENFEDKTPLVNEEGIPFDPDRDPIGSARIAPTGFEILQEDRNKTRERTPTVMEGMSEPKPENVRTPAQAEQDLRAGKVNISPGVGVNERHTEFLRHEAVAKASAEIRAKIMAYADMFQGSTDVTPEEKENAKKVLAERRAEAAETHKLTGLGRSGVMNAILKGYGKYKQDTEGVAGKVAKGSARPIVNVALRQETAEQARDEDAINKEINRTKTRGVIGQMMPGALPKEEKQRWVTPYALENFKTYLQDRHAEFMNRRTFVTNLYNRLGFEAAFRNHNSRVDEQGLSQCGNADCIRNQKQSLDAARASMISPDDLHSQLKNNFIIHHGDEALVAMKRMEAIGHKEWGTRYDESNFATDQPTHHAEECPHILPDGSKGLITDPISGQQHTCRNHINPNRIDPASGEPVVSDWHQMPLALTYSTKLPDGSSGTVHVEHPGLEDFLKCPAYTEPGGIEDQINAVRLLNAHANTPENKKEFGDFFASKATGYRALTRGKMINAVQAVLGSTSKFKQAVTNRKVGVYSDEYTDTASGKKVRQRIGTKIDPLHSIINTGATSFRRPGDEFGDSFRVAGISSDTKAAIGAFVDLGLRHFKTQKDLPNDVSDILKNSPRAQERLERAQSRSASVKTAFERMANSILGAHKQAEVAKVLSRSQSQGNRKLERTASELGFVSEGRERGPSSPQRTQDLLSENLVEQGNKIAEIAGTVTGDTRTFIPLAATGGNRGSGVPGGMPISEPRRATEEVEEEPEAPMSQYSTTSAPKAPAPTIKTPEETEADIKAYAAKKKAQRKSSKNTQPPDPMTLQ